MGLALLGAPAGGAVPGTAVLFFTELVVVLFGRLKSAAQGGTRDNTCSAEKAKGSLKAKENVGFKSGLHNVGNGFYLVQTFVAIFLISAGFPSLDCCTNIHFLISCLNKMTHGTVHPKLRLCIRVQQ